jgi:D-alanine--poly(phosphoribitol) ligase subunit 1
LTKTFYEKLWSVICRSSENFYIYYNDRQSYPALRTNIEKLNGLLADRYQQRIVVYSEKSFETYCVLFSILLSENTWIPLSPGHPENRTLKAFELCRPDVIFTDRPLPAKLATFAANNNCQIIDLHTAINDTSRIPLVLGNFDKNDIAYIMFTSGSTGAPKGVPMTHLNYVNFVENAMTILPFKKGDVFSDYHDLGFDISIFYLFCAILAEGALSPFLRDEEKFVPIDHIIKNEITVWSSVPSAILNLTRLRPHDQIATPLRIMFLCGEPFRLDVLKYCYDNMAIESVYNFYGLTETGVENFYHACTPEDVQRFEKKGFVPIGKPLAGNQVRVSENKELLITGCQVTPGYLGGIGTERFSEFNGAIWYHTGDFVEVEDGLFYCKGRADSQVKLSGFRIELMDIEVCTRALPGISDAVCFLQEGKRRTHLSCAIETSITIDTSVVTEHLNNELPSYMVPTRFLFLEAFPRNANGKVDRNIVSKLAESDLTS